MRVAIVGSRGIPAQYGGFEVFAEKLAQWLTQRGTEVTVYTVADLASQQTSFPVRRIFVRAPKSKSIEKLTLSAKAMVHAVLRERPDIILLLGVSGVPLLWLAKLRGIKVVFNPDGLEHLRTKWCWFGRFLLKHLESAGVSHADCTVADSQEIRKYICRTHRKSCLYIPYGTEPNGNSVKEGPIAEAISTRFGVQPNQYYITVGRFVPENNFDILIHAHAQSHSSHKLIVVADKLSNNLRNTKGVIFDGPVYDRTMLSALRHCAAAHFHGHSVGGTNPSLLEAVASGNVVFAYDVPFNREVTGQFGLYFRNSSDLATLIERYERGALNLDVHAMHAYYQTILHVRYNWDVVCEAYSRAFTTIMNGHLDTKSESTSGLLRFKHST